MDVLFRDDYPKHGMEYVAIERVGPLTAEEERELFRRWREDDDEEAHDRLTKSQVGWALKLANAFCRKRSWNNHAGAISAAFFGLSRAISRWQADGGARLCTYATFMIRRELQIEFAKDKTIRIPLHLLTTTSAACARENFPYVKTSGESFSQEVANADVVTDGDTGRLEEEEDFSTAQRDLAGFLSRLGAREREVLQRFYWQGQTQAEIGEALGVTKQRVSQLRQKAERSLKVWLRAASTQSELPPSLGRLIAASTNARPLT